MSQRDRHASREAILTGSGSGVDDIALVIDPGPDIFLTPGHDGLEGDQLRAQLRVDLQSRRLRHLQIFLNVYSERLAVTFPGAHHYSVCAGGDTIDGFRYSRVVPVGTAVGCIHCEERGIALGTLDVEVEPDISGTRHGFDCLASNRAALEHHR